MRWTALTHQLTPVITAHGANTNGAANDFAALLFITDRPTMESFRPPRLGSSIPRRSTPTAATAR